MKHARPDYDRIQDPAGIIPDDEPVFVLRAQDRTAASVVRLWAEAQKTLDDRDDQAIALAEAHADLMDAWPTKHTADV